MRSPFSPVKFFVAFSLWFVLGPAAPALAQNLLAYWKLNESSGTSAADSSGNGHTGTVTGTTSWVSAMCNNGFSFNGSTKIQATGLMGNPANFTLMAWANLTTADTNGAEIISLGDCAILRLDESGAVKGVFYNGSSWVSVAFAQTYAGTGWHHFAVTFNDAADSLKLYIDGALVATTSTTSSVSYIGLGANTVIGRHGNGSTSWDFTGTIDDVRVYDDALSAADILEIYGHLAYWKLDESSGTSAADSSAYGRTGTVTGTTNWSSAVVNNGFTFNGSTKIQATGLLGNPSSFTVAAWANLTTADTSGSEIISLGDRVYLRLDEGGVAKIAFYNGSSFVTATYSAIYAGTGCHHFAGVFNNSGDTLKLYIDGVQVASTSTTSNVSYSSGGSNTVIGRNGNGGTANDFTGSVDEVHVYNYALSATDVATLYGFVGYWKLNATSGTTATDSSPFGNNGTLSGTAHWSTDCGGMNVFDFDGSTNYFSVTSASQLQPTSALTITAWIKGDSWGSGSESDTILRKGDNNPNNYMLSIADGKLMLCLDDTDTAGIRSTATLSTGQWYHVAATWDGSTVKLYINGVLDSSTARSGTINTDTRTLYIGGRSGTDCFDGMIRDVRLYNRALKASDIQLLAGLVGYWPFSEGSGTTAADSSGAGNNATLSGGASWTTDCAGNNNALLTNGTGGIAQTASAFTPPDIGTVALWVRSTGAPAGTARILGLGGDWEIRQQTDGTVVTDLCGDGGTTICTTTPITEVGRWYHLAFTFDSSNNTYAIYVDGQLEASGTNSVDLVQQPAAVLSFGTRTGATEYWSGALRDVRVYNRKLCPSEIQDLYGLVLYWKLDETSGNSAADSSGMGRTGTVTGTASWTAGKISNAIQLNGTNHVEVSSLLGNPKNITIAAWGNLTAADTGGAELVSIGDYFKIRLNEGSTTRAYFYNGSSSIATSISQTYTGWHHFAAVFNDNADVCKLYVDANEVASTSTTVTIPWSGLGTKTVIGAHGNGATNYDWSGKIDDVRIYNRALCPTEIQQIKNLGGTFGGVKVTKWYEIQ